MRVEIRVYGDLLDTALAYELLDKKNQRLLKSKGVILEELDEDKGRLYLDELVIEFALVFSTTVAGELVANWLYDKIKNRAHKLEIRKVRVQIDKEEIKKVIVEIVEEEKD